MSEMGDALMGTGCASGEDRAKEAAVRALRSPLLDDVSIAGAKGLLINVTGGTNMTLAEVADAANTIFEAAGADAHVIFGTAIDESLTDEIRVTVIATGIGKGKPLSSGRLVASEKQPVATEPSPLRRALRRREIPEVNPDNRLSLNPNIDVDYDTPAFMRRHCD